MSGSQRNHHAASAFVRCSLDASLPHTNSTYSSRRSSRHRGCTYFGTHRSVWWELAQRNGAEAVMPLNSQHEANEGTLSFLTSKFKLTWWWWKITVSTTPPVCPDSLNGVQFHRPNKVLRFTYDSLRECTRRMRFLCVLCIAKSCTRTTESSFFGRPPRTDRCALQPPLCHGTIFVHR